MEQVFPRMIVRLFSEKRINLRLLALVLFFMQSYTLAATQTPPASKPPSKEGKTYASASIVMNEFRSVALPIVRSSNPESTFTTKFPLTAQTYALAATYGTYITDNFKTELRYGRGIVDDTLDEILDININHYFNWYIGGAYPVTDEISAYGLIGVSFYEADITRREQVRKFTLPGDTIPKTEKVQPSPYDLDEDLFGTKFSMSWMLGFDYHLEGNWYLAFEYGRLLKDTDSNIKVYQAGTQLRYEF